MVLVDPEDDIISVSNLEDVNSDGDEGATSLNFLD